jgi:hypothetical protein
MLVEGLIVRMPPLACAAVRLRLSKTLPHVAVAADVTKRNDEPAHAGQAVHLCTAATGQ